MMAAAQDLWAKLAGAGLATGKIPSADEAQAPWYVRVMLGIAGLISAVFLLGFVAVGLAFIIQSIAASVAVGFMVITASYAVFRMAPRNDFTSMFALAVSIAGQGLVVYGLVSSDLSDIESSIAVTVLEAVLAIVMPNFIHRVASAYAAGIAFAVVCEHAGIRTITIGALAIAVAYVWLNEARLAKHYSILTPVGHGLTLAFITIQGSLCIGHSVRNIFGSRRFAESLPWTGEALVVAALLGAVFVLLRRNGWRLVETKTFFALLATAVIGVASFKAPGIAGGLLIILLGFSSGNRVLTGLGIAALLFYVSSYYYFLDTTLLVKSGVLLATGVTLLAARWVVLHVIMKDRGNA